MGHCHLHGRGNIDDRLMLRIGLPHIQHGVAHLNRVIHLRLGEALRAVFKCKIALRLIRKLFQECCTVHRKLLHFLPALSEHLLSLRNRGGIIKVDHRMGRSLYRLKGLAYDMLPRLSEHLNGHIIGNHVSLNQFPDKIVLRIRRRRKSNLDLLEAHLHKHFEKLQLLIQIHGLHQRLIAVPQIHTAPDGRFVDAVLLHPVISHHRRHKI